MTLLSIPDEKVAFLPHYGQPFQYFQINAPIPRSGYGPNGKVRAAPQSKRNKV
jgi:hypothetical protein